MGAALSSEMPILGVMPKRRVMVGLPQQLSTVWLIVSVVAFLAKHLITDFFLQTKWMALGKTRTVGWVLPLSVHTGVHAAGTLAICLALAPALSWFAVVDFFVHFLLDRVKAVLARRWSATPDQQIFWWLLGTDQTLHALTHFIFALWIAAARGAAGP
ncbi:hypothetical protein M2322_003882 [Rhodoblastus acidophilus]|uniref:DUF3307 domain-containing protein n=1 Tax=Rhodoblastus acidophilus TaxID=1074 RepID=UPI002223FDF5|nr:DUF3307 domain-containing protein [Rhodoblastus acidophilus]MCW2318313.1 hypothetical protein [Rhodoblastus acidophilus]